MNRLSEPLLNFGNPGRCTGRAAIWSAALLALAGCSGSSGDRLPLEGTVHRQGQPVKAGTIAFVPADTGEGPSTAAKIVDGAFSISADDGLPPGTYQATVSADTLPAEKQPGRPAAVTPPTPLTQTITVKTNDPNRFELKFD